MIDRTARALANAAPPLAAAAPPAAGPPATRPGTGAQVPAAHPFAELLQQNRNAARGSDTQVGNASALRPPPPPGEAAATIANARESDAPAAPSSKGTAKPSSPAPARASDPTTPQTSDTATAASNRGRPGTNVADHPRDDVKTRGDAADEGKSANATDSNDADATSAKDDTTRSHGLAPTDAGFVASQLAGRPVAPSGDAPLPTLAAQRQDAGSFAQASAGDAAPGGAAGIAGALTAGTAATPPTRNAASDDPIGHGPAGDGASTVADAAIAAGAFATTLADSTSSHTPTSHGGPGADGLATGALQAASTPPAATSHAGANGLATTSLPTPLHSPAFAAALGVQVSVFAKEGIQRAELHLNPADMGPVSIRITLDGTQARVDFGADTAATRQAIEAGLPQLASAMRDAGFTLAGGGVSQHSGSGNASSDDGSDRSGARNRGTRVSTAATARLGAAAEQMAQRAGQSALDLYA